EGDWDEDEGVVICPRHGANFDMRTGDALTLPAFQPVSTYVVRVFEGLVRLQLPRRDVWVAFGPLLDGVRLSADDPGLAGGQAWLSYARAWAWPKDVPAETWFPRGLE